MGYISELDVSTDFWDRNTKLVCTNCGKVYQDTSGKNSRSVKVEFGEIKIDGVKCKFCDCETFNLTAYIESYCINTENINEPSKEDEHGEVDNEEIEEMDNVSE